MSEEEYVRYVDELLVSLGGSWGTPAGHGEDSLYFSCLEKPIRIPQPHKISAEQRKIIVQRFADRFAFPYIPD